tara:strand:+ start:754 stop:1770 length:1017 start_codon:yes stop_codon:yes gene_type:complete
MSKIAFVTGVSGQDGPYLCKHLIDKGYQVIGGDRANASGSLWRLDYLGIKDKVKIVDLELSEMTNIIQIFQNYKFDEVYNLASQSFVASSFKVPLMTSDITGLGVARLLECIRLYNPDARFYQASTSEMFGKVSESPQNEDTLFHPRSPYGVSKLYGHWMTINYRESYDLFACNGILFNHESPLRGEHFVTRKISMHVAAYNHGNSAPLELGNLSAKRDWGFAGDYVSGMWLMLQHDKPMDFVLATGQNHSVREFVELAFNQIGVAISWNGEGEHEVGYNDSDGEIIVKVNPEFYRPAEVENLLGDYSKAKAELGWEPKVSFQSLVESMVAADIERLS